jgi:hypothetical protein
MTDEGREAQSKSDRRPAAAGSRFDPAAPAPARPNVPAPSAPTPPPATTPPATPPNVATPYAAGPISRPVATPPFDPARPRYAPPADPRAAAGQDDFDDDELEAEEPHLTLAERVRTLQPAPVIMTIGSIGALVFLGRAVTSHTTPVPVLLSAGVVSCLVFGIDAGVATLGTYRAGREGRLRRALLLSVVGGVAALISAGAFSGVLVMVLVLNS